ncbi:MAG: hypothetical protein IPK32_06475 [Verrucomicrobiaceae bacterium]|nr:hypothetical protein [Verrucomicrobiaceae bacterium]
MGCAQRPIPCLLALLPEGSADEKTGSPAASAIRTATSRDFIHWENQQDLRYTDSPGEALYTNQVKPYHRAPHLLLGFPTRYIERGWSESMRALPEYAHRQWRSKATDRYGMAITEGLFMASRDGVTFKALERGLPPTRHRAPWHLELRSST